MKASDSATSLTQLTGSAEEPVCLFCADPDDQESGKTLVKSSAIQTCGCKFATHLSCWNEYLHKETPAPRTNQMACPLCRKLIHPWRATVYIDKSAQPAPKPFIKTVLCFGTAALTTLGVVIYYSVSH
jgi:hypothetical protein